jgi:hypothetical protein
MKPVDKHIQKRAVSPEEIEKEAIVLNFGQSLTMSLHQNKLEILVTCGVELL